MKHKSLRSSMLVLYITSILIPFFVISSLYSYYYNMQILTNNKANISNTLTSLSTGIGIYVSELNSISNVPYLTPNVFQTMEDINSGKYVNIESSIDFLKNSNNFRLVFLKYIYNSTQNISDVTFIPSSNDMNRIYIMSRNADQTTIITDKDYVTEPWYQYLAKHKKSSILSPVYQKTSRDGSDLGELTSFSYAKIIRNVDTKKDVGIIKVDIPADNITSLISQVTVSPSSSLLLTGRDGSIIYANTTSSQFQSYQNLEDITASVQRHYQIITYPVDNSQFSLVYYSSRKDVQNYQLLTYFLLFLLTLFAVFVSYLIYRHKANRITQSVAEIKNTFRRIETGDLTATCEVDSQAEFEEISHALNHMVSTLNESIIKEYKATLSQQEAEYRALQAQINPHFLYNTLNGFIALNRMGERKLLEDSVIRLTQLFQYTCSDSASGTLESELNFIEKYLNLQKLKYDERLSFCITADPCAMHLPLPKLLLQPLIENAVIHGMEPSDQPMLIRIEASLVSADNIGSFLLIRIQDNGAGFDMNTVKNSIHIGLKNTRRRICYIHPDNLFQIRSRTHCGTECLILMRSPSEENLYENTVS